MIRAFSRSMMENQSLGYPHHRIYGQRECKHNSSDVLKIKEINCTRNCKKLNNGVGEIFRKTRISTFSPKARYEVPPITQKMMHVVIIENVSVALNFEGSFMLAAIGRIRHIPSKENITVPISKGRAFVCAK